MSRSDLSRRDFHQLSMAAFGGVIAGSLAGCGDGGNAGTTPAPAGGEDAASGTAAGGEAQQVSLLLEEPHICRGLNTCKNLGKSKDNACAGQGDCASVVSHTCAGENACKGQGGCGGKHGENACKGMGGCGVPLAHGWEGVRKKFEEAMAAAGKTFGPAPAAM